VGARHSGWRGSGRLAALGSWAVALGFCALTGTLVTHRVIFLRGADQATATVVAEEKTVKRNGQVYCPVLSFTPSGTPAPIRLKSQDCSWTPKFQAGQTVSVLYDPNDPRTMELSGDIGPWVVIGLLATLDLAFFLMAVTYTRLARSRMRYGRDSPER
jgi:Protein of unknown function (DUF3592)